MIQIYRPPNHTDDDHRYALVVDGGDGGIELYEQGGELHDVTHLPDGWIEQVPVDQARAEPDQSTPEPLHADDCTGCDGPGIVPCAADRVIGNWAYRDGQPSKDLEADRG